MAHIPGFPYIPSGLNNGVVMKEWHFKSGDGMPLWAEKAVQEMCMLNVGRKTDKKALTAIRKRFLHINKQKPSIRISGIKSDKEVCMEWSVSRKDDNFLQSYYVCIPKSLLTPETFAMISVHSA